jgi:3-hydroxyisobutyrate dehydrogenase-like beta-hydroxyacid dehydrogenase
MDVAVLGIGRMGRAIAGRLLEGGHRVAVRSVWQRFHPLHHHRSGPA